MPYDLPPKTEAGPNTSVPPSNQPLGPEELKRAEALLPLLEGKQEFWAMGEFVHLGAPAVPVLVKALTMPGPRIRYNAIETLLMIKDASAAPALVEAAKESNDMPRIREHALRATVRLNPALAPPAIEAMAKDANASVRKVAAFESRYVRQKAVVPVLIGLLSDQERFVAVSAIHSLWLLTRHESEVRTNVGSGRTSGPTGGKKSRTPSNCPPSRAAREIRSLRGEPIPGFPLTISPGSGCGSVGPYVIQ
jgi:hypothetical protein